MTNHKNTEAATGVLLEETCPHNPCVQIQARKEDDLNIEISDGYEGISLHGQEIWWLFEQLHILYNKAIGDF